MIPVFIGLQVKKALRVAASEMVLSDIDKKKLSNIIMSKLEADKGNKSLLCEIKGVTQDDMTLSITLVPEIAQEMILRERGKRWSLIIKRGLGENQTEFVIDTFRKINIIFG